jgi:hypothetical protein
LDPEAQRRKLLAMHPACTSVDPWKGEKPVIYTGRQYRSVSEAKLAMWMRESSVEFDYEVAKTYRDDLTGYKPDFYLAGGDFFIEVADFRGRYTEQKIRACKEAADRLDVPVVLLRGFPWFQDEKPFAKIATVFLPRGLNFAEPEVSAAWPAVAELLAIDDDNSKLLIRKVVNTIFEDLDPNTGEPRPEKLQRFEQHRQATLQRMAQLEPLAHRLNSYLSCGYPERRYPQISQDLQCTKAEAAMACYQLAVAGLAPADIADVWRSVNLEAVNTALRQQVAR